MTQGENVNPYPWKQKRKEGKFPIKEKAKRKERKFLIKEWEKEKKREGEEGKKAPDQGSKENRRNVQRGLQKVIGSGGASQRHRRAPLASAIAL